MVNKSSFIKFCTALLVFSVILGCQPKNQLKTDKCEADCLSIHTTHSRISFNTKQLYVESLFDVEIVSDKKIKSVELAPINMQMGVIYLFLTTNTEANRKAGKLGYSYQSQVMFGMCSEPHMQWLMTIKYHDDAIDTATLDSYWNESYL